MGLNYESALKNVENIKNYRVTLYGNDSFMTTAKNAAKIKIALMNDIRIVEIEGSLYTTKSISSVVRFVEAELCDKIIDYDPLSPPKEQVRARDKYFALLNMNNHIQNGKLVELKNNLLN